jgi:hypothetical protein
VIVENPGEFNVKVAVNDRGALNDVSEGALAMGSDIGVLNGLSEITGRSGASVGGWLNGVGILTSLLGGGQKVTTEYKGSPGIVIGEVNVIPNASINSGKFTPKNVKSVKIIAASDKEETPDSLARKTYEKIATLLATTGLEKTSIPEKSILTSSQTCPAGYVLSKTEADTCVRDPGAKEVKETRILAPADAAAVAE